MAVAELAPGALLGPTAEGGFRYEVARTLGAGGFGITYLAHDERLDGEVVVKEFACHTTSFRDTATGKVRPIHGQRDAHEKLVHSFVREAKLLNRLRSPHIVRVTDVWEERGSAYYAMDKVDFDRHLGEALADGLTTRSWTDAKVHALQLLDALESVHEAGLVHGDVKPANVLIDKRRGVVLIDFGTARADEEFHATITSTSFTRGYAPPELMHPSRVREAGPWSNLYSWAMVVWELVMPHPGDGGLPVDATARLRGFDAYLDAAGQLEASGMPEAWATTLDTCIRLEPSQRPRSVTEVRAMLAGGHVPAHAAATLIIDRPDLTRRSASAVSRATTTIEGAEQQSPEPPVPTPGSFGSAPPTTAAVGTTEPPEREDRSAWLIGAAFAFVAIAGVGIAAATQETPPESPHEVVESSEAVDDGSSDGPVEADASAATATPADDECGGCEAGLICISNACHYPHAESVMEQYRALLDHWNEGNSKGFFSQYNDPMTCYYSRAHFALASLRVLRGQHFVVPDGSRFEIEELGVLHTDEESVVLMDTGLFLADDGREKPHVRRVEYRMVPNRGWRITIEASLTSHGCAADWFD